jgi:ABC-type iron transport system FetAB permease component
MPSAGSRLALWLLPPLVPTTLAVATTFILLPVPATSRLAVTLLAVGLLLLIALHTARSFLRVAPALTDDEWRASWRLNLVGSIAATVGVAVNATLLLLRPRGPIALAAMTLIPLCFGVAVVALRKINLRWARFR